MHIFIKMLIDRWRAPLSIYLMIGVALSPWIQETRAWAQDKEESRHERRLKALKEKHPKLSQSKLISSEELKRHRLPKTGRSFMHLALSYRSVLHVKHSNFDGFGIGIGGPLLSYDLLYWRTFSLWLFEEGPTLETNLSFKVLATDLGAVHIGAQAGFHTIPDGYQSISYDGYSQSINHSNYANVDHTFIGFHLKMMWASLWTEITFDFSSVGRESSSYEYTEAIELIKLGISLGSAF